MSDTEKTRQYALQMIEECSREMQEAMRIEKPDLAAAFGAMATTAGIAFLLGLHKPSAPAAAQKPSTHEHHIALREAHEIAAERAYFNARPDLPPTGLLTTVFEAGFRRGFDAAASLAVPPAPAAQPSAEPELVRAARDFLRRWDTPTWAIQADETVDAAIDALRRALAASDGAGEARTDTQRLDFIAQHARSDPQMDGQHVWWPTNFKHALRGPTLRAAIDNAMGDAPKTNVMVCRKCGADRSREACKGNLLDCGFMGTAATEAQGGGR